MKKFFVIIFLSSILCACESKDYEQWFIGTLLAPAPSTPPCGELETGVALFTSTIYGFYDRDGGLREIDLVDSKGIFIKANLALTSRIGIDARTAYFFNRVNGKSVDNQGDSVVRLGFQVSKDDPKSWLPDFRLMVQENLPTGNFTDLEFDANSADKTGNGTFETGFHLAFQKMMKLGCHPFRIRASGGYFIPANADVDGVSAFGGDIFTEGRVKPGNYATFFCAAEYAISKRLALMCDSNLTIGEGGDFERARGGDIDLPSYYQISLAPALELTFTEKLGFLLGTWFTVKGKSSSAFHLWYTAIAYTF